MPKAVSTNQEITNPTNSLDSSRYAPIPEGIYYGVITELAWDTFQTRAGYSMEKFTPTVELMNPEATVINRQDFTIGAINSAGEYTSEFFGDGSSVIFGSMDVAKGRFGARNLMFALGMLNSKGTVVFNEQAIANMVVKVRVETRSYSYKGETRHENVITNFDVPTGKDLNDLLDFDIDYTNWVTYNMCTREESSNAPAEHARLVFTDQNAFNTWYTHFYGNEGWENPVGVLESEQTALQTWTDYANVAMPSIATPEISNDELPF
jgi:hypothetical protein